MLEYCAGLCCLMMLTLAVDVNAQATACIELEAGNPVKTVAAIPVNAGAVVRLEYINSLYRAPVRETLVYDEKDGISIIMVESPSAGVLEYNGLEADGTGRSLMRRVVGDFTLRSHDYADHRIMINDRVVSLKGLIRGGEPLVVKVSNTGECPP